MAIDWTTEKINACSFFFGKVPWKLVVGDKCVKRADLLADAPPIELVNTVGSDVISFMTDKVWLLTSDDIEKILLERGWLITTNISKISNVGGLAYECVCSVTNDNATISATDADPHFARIKLLQRVLQHDAQKQVAA